MQFPSFQHLSAHVAPNFTPWPQTFTKLRAEVNLLKRNNLRLKADKAADLQKMEELAAAGRALRQQLADSKVTADKLRAEVGGGAGV
jgi:hypothetical protein